TTAARRRARGANPARQIADAAAAAWGRDVREDLLERVSDDGPQRGSGRDARRRHVAGAFRATGPAPGEVWLVDDVVTTGATLSACAHALRRAGARRVCAVAFARVTHDGPRRVAAGV
ncbi:MAG: ComF family protein, partial [Thermoleophilia bacterium]|nr:ComF family protein [Thermoleophilia bacterium]